MVRKTFLTIKNTAPHHHNHKQDNNKLSDQQGEFILAKVYSESPELRVMAEKLIDRYSLQLPEVNIDTIYFAEIEGTKSKRGKIGEITGIPTDWVKQRVQEDLNSTQVFCLAVYADDWVEVPPSSREWLVFSLLRSINPDPAQFGKLRKPDVQEDSLTLQYLVTNGIPVLWRNGQVPLPSLLNGTILSLPIPVSEEDDTAGSTLGDD